MKNKILLFCNCLFLTHTLFAQITVQNYHFMPIGKNMIWAIDTNNFLPGPGGANQTWNFSNALNNFSDTFSITNPNWTPYASNFPGCNVAM